MLTIEVLKKRISEISNAIVNQNNNVNQAVANLHVLEGAKQESEYWLEQLEGRQKEIPEDIKFEDIKVE
jgi:hypothetical protein